MIQFHRAKIGDVADLIRRAEVPIAGKIYRQIGVRLWGEGAYEREELDGANTRYRFLSRVKEGDIIVNKIWARNGSVAVVNNTLDGCFGSTEFPTFAPIRNKLDPQWFHWITKTKWFWELCDEKSRGTSGKNRIRPEKFLEIEIPLPSLQEQNKIVAYLAELTNKINEISANRKSANKGLTNLLLSTFYKLTHDVEYRTMEEVAPLIRRQIEVKPDESYLELGVRSFGNGTFHKPEINGFSLGSKRVFYIEPNDLIFSNVFAWEGAIAVAKPEDKGRIGSHRFITCAAKENLATPEFLCFYFLTSEGLEKIRKASPGGAGRNRTLGIEKLMKISLPLPKYEEQVWFTQLLVKVDELRRLQSESERELSALMPSILDRAFKGEL
jgi:type I restriction enzyme S subunit